MLIYQRAAAGGHQQTAPQPHWRCQDHLPVRRNVCGGLTEKATIGVLGHRLDVEDQTLGKIGEKMDELVP